MILIIAEEVDSHARRVRQLIDELGHEVAILDFARLAGNARYVHEIGPQRPLKRLIAGYDIDFCEVRTIWVRRPSMAAVPDSVVDEQARQFIRHEWAESLNGMTLTLPGVRWVNHPVVQATASKPLQLDVARAAGMPVPETLISNDAELVRAFLKRHGGNVVHKSLTAPHERFIDTRRWVPESDEPHLESSLRLAPVIFQEYVAGHADIRTVMAGDRFFSVAVDLSTSRAAIDSRLDLDARCVPHELPHDVVRRLRSVMARLDLVFGVVDMRIDENGEYVFLEINPQGQFLFMEILTRQPISAGVAAFLSEGEG